MHNATSALCLEGWDGDDPKARWQVVASQGTVEADQMPNPVQGVKGTVFEDETWNCRVGFYFYFYLWRGLNISEGMCLKRCGELDELLDQEILCLLRQVGLKNMVNWMTFSATGNAKNSTPHQSLQVPLRMSLDGWTLPLPMPRNL